ncbi:DUF4476 domain-containing protein [Chitinophaga sp. 22321]|uniref:DUF4476 domain-containing protein n=1 Tax=Chitinophaga hostae TaxID=2831022 RepID=A0ABS5JAR2_9BACT|nr:DUF4476 domain-containing protein [Chitinophaga hostae]MBS0032294.1 DUF4476 domain-containing protein [Chitinophaga hostae]
MHLKYRTVVFVWACLLLCGRLLAQEQHHYVYIQSEKGQPFYVKHNGKVLSSTERGYIIIPQLESGTTPITVGLAKDEGHESQFYLKIAKNDQGFLLKQSGEAGYSLYNLQTFREIKSEAGAPATPVAETAAVADSLVPELDTAKKEMMTNLQKDLETTFADKAIVTGPAKTTTPAKSSNPFSSALDKVVVTGDDRNEPVEEVKPAAPPADVPVATGETGEVKKSKGKKRKGEREPLTEEEQAILTDVLAEEGKAAASEAATEEVAKATPAASEEPVKKHKKHKAKEGDPDFIEFQDDKSQAPVAAVKATAAPVVVEVPVTTPEEPTAPVKKKKKRGKLFDDTENPPNIITDSSGYGVAVARPVTEEEPVKSKKKKKRSEEETAVDAAGAPVGAEVVPDVPATEKKKASDARLLNSDCTNIMDEATFRKLLRKFVAARTDNSMIDVFRKQTRNYCLETAQIKTLVQLLTADDTRYRLLDAGYSKTYDTEKYGSLESLLIDDYYRGRFKAMLHK